MMANHKLLELMRAWRDGEAERGMIHGLKLYGKVVRYVEERERLARLEERKWLEGLPGELEERITNLMTQLPYDVREATGQPDTNDRYRLAQENATTSLRTYIRLAIGECERQARLDEHKLLAGLDEEGKKQRYLELAHEDTHGML